VARVIVTRPEQHAATWLAALGAIGHEAIAFPLIETVPVQLEDDQQALQAAWQSLENLAAVMFVSSSAVHAFFQSNRHLALTESSQSAIDLIVDSCPQLRLWATGQGTLASLRSLGVPPERMDAPDVQAEQFDSEALWRIVRPQVSCGKAVLIVRGRDMGQADGSRDWLAQQIVACGGVVRTVVAYERRAPQWHVAQIAQMQRWLQDGSIWLLSSSQALRNLPASLNASDAVCICTHERIAQAARQRGFAVVCTSRPTMQDVAASIESINV
jgi:uroporphyrinogen-III synthase